MAVGLCILLLCASAGLLVGSREREGGTCGQGSSLEEESRLREP